MKPLVYVAAPYSTGDQVENTRQAILWGERIYETGLMVPYVPHLTIAWHLASPHPVEFWYEYDRHLLRRCDALYRVVGLSRGADAEAVEAKSLGLPTFNVFALLCDWAEVRLATIETVRS